MSALDELRAYALARCYPNEQATVERLIQNAILEAQHTPDCEGMTCPGWYSAPHPNTGDEMQVECACPHHRAQPAPTVTREQAVEAIARAMHRSEPWPLPMANAALSALEALGVVKFKEE